jgi:hypothetical protein
MYRFPNSHRIQNKYVNYSLKYHILLIISIILYICLTKPSKTKNLRLFWWSNILCLADEQKVSYNVDSGKKNTMPSTDFSFFES